MERRESANGWLVSCALWCHGSDYVVLDAGLRQASVGMPCCGMARCLLSLLWHVLWEQCVT